MSAPDCLQAPAPGVYRDVPMFDYQRWDCASSGRLERMRRSPLHCAWDVAHPDEDTTPARELGTAIHAAVLEPERFGQAYCLQPPGDGRTSAVRAARTELQARGLKLLSEDGWNACAGIHAAIKAHEGASKLMAHAREVEVSIVSQIEGILVRIRPDMLLRGPRIIGDLKTTTDASPEGFSRQIYSLGYHRKAALYLDTARGIGIPVDFFVLLAAEKDPPYAVACYTLAEQAIDLGRSEYLPYLRRYAACRAEQSWPGYPPTVVPIDVPPYAYSRQPEEVAA